MINKNNYEQVVEQKTPSSKLLKNMCLAFIFGGLICVIGQGVGDLYKALFNMDQQTVKLAVPVTMIFLGALFTGLNLYDNLAKHAGAGTLVPITGFANSIVAPAMEFKKEGYIMGLSAKMFVIAGPVLVYGIISSIVVGLLYYFYSN